MGLEKFSDITQGRKAFKWGRQELWCFLVVIAERKEDHNCTIPPLKGALFILLLLTVYHVLLEGNE